MVYDFRDWRLRPSLNVLTRVPLCHVNSLATDLPINSLATNLPITPPFAHTFYLCPAAIRHVILVSGPCCSSL